MYTTLPPHIEDIAQGGAVRLSSWLSEEALHVSSSTSYKSFAGHLSYILHLLCLTPLIYKLQLHRSGLVYTPARKVVSVIHDKTEFNDDYP
jgi:hypothetical protein